MTLEHQSGHMSDLVAIAHAQPQMPVTALDPQVIAAVAVLRARCGTFIASGMTGDLTAADCNRMEDALEEMAEAVRDLAKTLLHREVRPADSDR
jgi:hypothetical protein